MSKKDKKKEKHPSSEDKVENLQKKPQIEVFPPIMVTGVRGFIGEAILKRLEGDKRFPDVVAVDIRKPRLELKKSRFYQVDFTEPTADRNLVRIMDLENIQIVVHAAFSYYPTHNTGYSHEFEVIGTLHLLHAASRKKIKKIIVAGTTEVYGAVPTNPNFLTEEMPLRADMTYSYLRNKVQVERELKKFKAKHPRIIITVLRLCTVLGPRARNTATKFLSLPAVYTILGFDPLIQFVWEDDVTDAFMSAIEKDYDGAFNIVGDGVLPLTTVSKLAGKITLPVLRSVASPVFGFLWILNLTVAPPKHMNFIRFLWVADGAKAKKVMKFRSKVSAKEALLRHIANQRLKKYQLLKEGKNGNQENL